MQDLDRFRNHAALSCAFSRLLNDLRFNLV